MNPLEQWSIAPVKLPGQPVKRLHIYDFDNTLFKTPKPTTELYTSPTFQQLIGNRTFLTGGWWADPVPLELFLKLQKEDGTLEQCWNANLMPLTQLSYEQEDTISILMTGRREDRLGELIIEILECSRRCNPSLDRSLQFNAVCLKKDPDEHTMDYKLAVIDSFLEYYPTLEEVTIYDDRLNQINGFKNHLNMLSDELYPKLQWFVIPVDPFWSRLPPFIEYGYFQDMIRRHNEMVNLSFNNHAMKPPSKWKVRSTQWQLGYFLSLSSYQLLEKAVHDKLATCFPEFGVEILNDNYTFNIINHNYYPCYIPACPPGVRVTGKELYRIYQPGSQPSNAKSNKCFQSFYYAAGFKNHDVLEPCHIMFNPVKLGVNVEKIDSQNKVINVTIFVKFKPERSCPGIFGQYKLVSHIEELSQYKRGQQVSNESIEIDEGNMYWMDWENDLKIDTTFGTFSKMRCLRAW